MSITPFRVRITSPGDSPPWLREGTGERLLTTFGLMVDCRMERLTQGMLAHMPRSDISNTVAPMDALLIMADDRVIVPGQTEGQVSLATREQRAFDDWQLAGLPRGVMSPTLGYLLTLTPEIRTIATTFDYSTFPPARVTSTWTTYAAGADVTVAPTVGAGVVSGAGDFDWDSLSPITGSWGWWSGYVVIYAVAPNDWCHVAEAWGTGSVYTPSADGYYSTGGTVGGIPAYVPAGSYTGTTRAWGAGSTYTAAASGYYSKAGTVNGLLAYVGAGSYNGVSVGWGVDVLGTVGTTLQGIVKQRKPANVWVRSIVVSFDATLFDPAQPAGGGVNPDGTFGQWSTAGTVGGLPAYVASRFSSAVYGGEVI